MRKPEALFSSVYVGDSARYCPQLEAGSLNESVRDEMETNLGY